MCVLRVANARKSEQRLRVEGVRDDEMDAGAASGVMFPGHNREREMSATVTALTNVVAGHVSDDLVNQTGSDPCCLLGSCSWGAGHKRGRDDQGHVSESVSTISRAFGDLSHGGSSSFREMAVPEVNKELLGELEAMGFPVARATRALHFSGNDSLAAAVSWIIDHENDPDIDQMPSITVDIGIESPKPFQISEEMKKKAQELRNRARRRQEEEEKKREREREKNRIRAGKELLEAKRIDEENERKRMLAYWESEKEEQKRAREKLLKKLMEDKAERRSKLGLPPENPASVKTSLPVVLEKNSLFTKLDTKAEPLRECLRFLKKSHKNDDARVKRAFQTLLIYIRNVAKHPDEEKFRKIRFSNPAFQERVGSLTGGIEFLELCGFERTEDGEFLFLPQEKVDMAVLNSAGSVLNSAMTNPFFGVFSS